MRSTHTDIKKLRWRSRRGMQELDTLLNSYLDLHSEQLDSQAVDKFNTLLQTEDDLLWLWLSGQQACTESRLTGLVNDIRAAI